MYEIDITIMIKKQIYFDEYTERLHQQLREQAEDEGRGFNLSSLVRRTIQQEAAKNGITVQYSARD